MRRLYGYGFATLLLFDTAGQVCFKLAALSAAPFTADVAWLLRATAVPWILGCIVAYIGAFLTWLTLLEHAPVGPAFAASHLEIVTVLALSVLLFGEQLHTTQMIGCAAIVSGILCLAKGTRRSAVVA